MLTQFIVIIPVLCTHLLVILKKETYPALTSLYFPGAKVTHVGYRVSIPCFPWFQAYITHISCIFIMLCMPKNYSDKFFISLVNNNLIVLGSWGMRTKQTPECNCTKVWVEKDLIRAEHSFMFLYCIQCFVLSFLGLSSFIQFVALMHCHSLCLCVHICL